MSQTIAIILKIGEGKTKTFEELFEQEILPLWHEFVSEGKLLAASLTPVEEGDYPRPAGFRYYILHVEMPGMTEHGAFDGDPRFLDFLSKAKKLQPEEPLVWFGTTLHQVPQGDTRGSIDAWLMRYLTEGSPEFRDIARVTASLANRDVDAD